MGVTIALVGSPNVGKSVIFSHLTGKYVTVSNYPGTTVELSRGKGLLPLKKVDIIDTLPMGKDLLALKNVDIIDTPGSNSIVPMSEDEEVTRNVLISGEIDYVVQVADEKNLQRALMISSELSELELPFTLVLNMADEARRKGVIIDIDRLSKILGVPVVETVAVEGKGIAKMKKSIVNSSKAHVKVNYGKLENSIEELTKILGNRGKAIMALSDESFPEKILKDKKKIEEVKEIIRKEKESISVPLFYYIREKRREETLHILRKVKEEEKILKTQFSEKLSNLTLNPVTGIPIFLGIVLLLYQFVGFLGAQVMVEFLEEKIFGEILNPALTIIFERYIVNDFISRMFVGEFGIVTMALTYAIAIIFPIVLTFFIAFGLLEDSGYFPRLAVMGNKPLKFLGLNGKAILPLILGCGCVTMATITVRTLDSKKERIIATLLLALGVPCSAQIAVIFAMASALSFNALLFVFSVVLLQLIIIGALSSKIIKGQSSDFIMELPPLRVPKFSNIIYKTLMRLEWYAKEVIPIFILGTLVLFFFNEFNILGVIERIFSPVVVSFLELPKEAARAFLMGFFRRDYGAAGLFQLQDIGLMSNLQTVVSLIVITLFVPCIANLFVIIKERGPKVAAMIFIFVLIYAVFVGGVTNIFLKYTGIMF
ncbi:MAG: ferrous iron transport protein B [Candidatus Methanofastidiosa archaeon]|nr:ferrous iron transport protein B [Candidatus Methanofastidiosa archaeon]